MNTIAAQPHVVPGVGHLSRCPKAVLRELPEIAARALNDYGWLQQHGVLPKAGALEDQDPRFVEAAGVIGEVAAAASRRHADARVKAAQEQARAMRAGGRR